MNIFMLHGLTALDFNWYFIGDIAKLKEKNIPQVTGELTVKNKPVIIDIIPSKYIVDGMSSINLIYNNIYLIVLDDSNFYIHHSLMYATRRLNNGLYIGLRNESGSD